MALARPKYARTSSLELKEDKVFKSLISGQTQGFFLNMMELNSIKLKNQDLLDSLKEKSSTLPKAREYARVVKRGKAEWRVIDSNKNKFNVDYVQNCTNRNKCNHIFNEQRMGKLDGKYKQFVKAKFQRKLKEVILNKINLILSLRAVTGLVYLKVMLEKIQLARQLFIADMQEGGEVYIPKELSMDHLPYSFRYYDPVISVV